MSSSGDAIAPLLPGATIGILGSGQLGRMLALAAREMGYRVHVFSPGTDTPAGQVADREFVGEYDDGDAIRAFAKDVDVVTFEFENVSSLATDAAAEVTRVHPAGRVLHTTQHRIREKTFLRDAGIPVPGFREINSLADLRSAADELGIPAVLKTASFGYDGKGQQKITPDDSLERILENLEGAQGIYEAFVDFEKEISIVAARTVGGEFKAFPVFENVHTNHILDVTFSPARITQEVSDKATEIASRVFDALDIVGVTGVEMFVTKDGDVLVNELAPRTHNSGHLTLDGCVTSQFEQQVRAVCGLPLGETALHSPSAMANLLGDVWQNGEPDWSAALRESRIKLHLYGKAEARPGRKMGHLNASAASVDEAIDLVCNARSQLAS
ncbi:MAG: 5-(carboxyamino)imidazole ribonucleotide synthase [Verrucomicrobiales bacterium]|nr:5-(carboxyamino)imidazole ribonucleotide synthase [Verrucomicrobiales bacterium]